MNPPESSQEIHKTNKLHKGCLLQIVLYLTESMVVVMNIMMMMVSVMMMMMMDCDEEEADEEKRLASSCSFRLCCNSRGYSTRWQPSLLY